MPRPRATQHSDARPVKQESLYGACEEPSCSRRARATCERCEGEYCLAHLEHDEHA